MLIRHLRNVQVEELESSMARFSKHSAANSTYRADKSCTRAASSLGLAVRAVLFGTDTYVTAGRSAGYTTTAAAHTLSLPLFSHLVCDFGSLSVCICVCARVHGIRADGTASPIDYFCHKFERLLQSVLGYRFNSRAARSGSQAKQSYAKISRCPIGPPKVRAYRLAEVRGRSPFSHLIHMRTRRLRACLRRTECHR
jgi:hypothetical protein